MSHKAVRAALVDWATELEAKTGQLTEFSAFARLIAVGDEAKVERLGELIEYHASEEALG